MIKKIFSMRPEGEPEVQTKVICTGYYLGATIANLVLILASEINDDFVC